jgi:LPS O-antigen subunit length determinant protein (WzzB/FepE family)
MEKDSIKEDYEEIEIDLYDYLRVIWRRRWLIVIGTIVVTMAAVFGSYLARNYESQGVLRLSAEKAETTVTLPEYKIYSANFEASRSFVDYLEKRKILNSEEMAYLKKKLRTEPFLDEYINPLYAYAEEEKKGVYDPEKQYISAVQLSWKGHSPKLAQRVVDAMGLFVKDVIERMVMERYVTEKYQGAYEDVHKSESALNALRFSLEQKQNKLADLRKIVDGLPKSGQIISKEVVSVADGGYYYLPPSTQMAATQVMSADTKLNINATQRKLTTSQVELELFTSLKKALREGETGDLFERVSGIKDGFFQGKDLSKDEILIVRNKVFSDFSGFEHWFHDVIRFVSGPTLPEKSMPSKRLVAAIAFILGFFFSLLLAFFLEFIRRSRQREKMEVEKKR